MFRRNPSLVEILVMLPWQVSAIFAVATFVSLRWVLPGIDFDNLFWAAFAKSAAGLSWFALIGLGLLAVVSAVMAAKKRALLDSQRDLESLRALTWQQFEWLVGEAYRRKGYTVEESIAGGADGGIDLILRKDGQTALVQCKRWKTQSVGAPIIREQFGLLTHHNADKVIVVTSGRFTREAVAFAEGKPVELVDGAALLSLVQSVQKATIPTPSVITSLPKTDSAAPALIEQHLSVASIACPTCGATMVKRTAKRGSNAGNSFWGCSNYPTCRTVRAA